MRSGKTHVSDPRQGPSALPGSSLDAPPTGPTPSTPPPPRAGHPVGPPTSRRPTHSGAPLLTFPPGPGSFAVVGEQHEGQGLPSHRTPGGPGEAPPCRGLGTAAWETAGLGRLTTGGPGRSRTWGSRGPRPLPGERLPLPRPPTLGRTGCFLLGPHHQNTAHLGPGLPHGPSTPAALGGPNPRLTTETASAQTGGWPAPRTVPEPRLPVPSAARPAPTSERLVNTRRAQRHPVTARAAAASGERGLLLPGAPRPRGNNSASVF